MRLDRQEGNRTRPNKYDFLLAGLKVLGFNLMIPIIVLVIAYLCSKVLGNILLTCMYGVLLVAWCAVTVVVWVKMARMFTGTWLNKIFMSLIGSGIYWAMIVVFLIDYHNASDMLSAVGGLFIAFLAGVAALSCFLTLLFYSIPNKTSE